MRAKLSGWNDKDVVELVLTLFAVIAGSIAAIGAFLGASYEKQRVDLEQKPALFLSCEPEFREVDLAEGMKPATNAALLTDDGARWIHLLSDGNADTPEPFASCTLTNYGQLPVFNIRMRIALHSHSDRDHLRTTRTFLDVPGLSPAASYTFALISGTNRKVRFAFEPALTLMRVDTGEQTAVPLFLSAELLALENRIQEPELRKSSDIPSNSNDEQIIRIRDFRFAPKVLRVHANDAITFKNEDPEPHTVTSTSNAFDSGTIDSGTAWTYRFAHPGTYWYTCTFHPHMRARIVVSSAGKPLDH